MSFVSCNALDAHPPSPQVDKLTVKQLNISVDHLIQYKWLQQDRQGDLSIGARTYLELPELVDASKVPRPQAIYH